MLAPNIVTHPVACRSCGAYGGTPCRPTCQPGRRYKLGRSRISARDRRTSAAVGAYTAQQNWLVRSL